MGGRLAVTGLGAVSSIGVGVAEFFKSICDGRSGISPLARFEADGGITHAFEIKDFKLAGKKSQALLRINKVAQYAIAAAKEAVEQSGYDVAGNPYDVAIVMSSSFVDCSLVTKYLTDVVRSGLTDFRPLLFPNTVPNALAAHVAIELKAKGPNIMQIHLMDGAFAAVKTAGRLLESGKAKLVLVIGADYLSHEMFLHFRNAGKLACAEASVPFSAESTGLMLGEGCGVMALERAADAEGRGAKVLAQVAGVNTFSFECGLTDFVSEEMPPVGEMFDKSLAAAGVWREEIGGYLSCANGCMELDRREDDGVLSCFGDQLPVTALSSYIGEACDGAILHLVAGCCCLNEGVIFPVLGYHGNARVRSNVLQKNMTCGQLKALLAGRAGLGGSYSTVILTRDG